MSLHILSICTQDVPDFALSHTAGAVLQPRDPRVCWIRQPAKSSSSQVGEERIWVHVDGCRWVSHLCSSAAAPLSTLSFRLDNCSVTQTRRSRFTWRLCMAVLECLVWWVILDGLFSPLLPNFQVWSYPRACLNTVWSLFLSRPQLQSLKCHSASFPFDFHAYLLPIWFIWIGLYFDRLKGRISVKGNTTNTDCKVLNWNTHLDQPMIPGCGAPAI